MAGNTVLLRFVGDTRDIVRSFNVVGGAADKTQSRFGKFSSAMKGFAAGAGAAIAIQFGKASVEAFKEAEIAQSKLEDAFKRFPALADTNISSLRKLNEQLAKKTVYDDDATASAQAVLAQFKLTGKEIASLTPLLQDYASKTGKDLPTAATDLGKALNGQGRALKAIGIDFKATGDRTADLSRLQEILNQKVGGFAEKEGKTAAGQAEIMKNKFGELQEKVGALLIPALSKLVDLISSLADWFEELSPATQKMIGVIVGLTVAMVALNAVMAVNPFVLAAVGIAALATALVVAYDKVEWFRKGVQGVFEFIKNYWPLLAGIMLGPFGLVTGLIIKNFDTIKAAVKSVIDSIKKALEFAGKLVDKVSHLPGSGLVKGAANLVGKIPGFATGGTVPGPIGAPMLAVVHGGEHVTPVGGRGPGGGPMTVNVYMPPGSDGQDVVAAIQRYERRNGPGWRQ